jgi:hypothetical protein
VVSRKFAIKVGRVIWAYKCALGVEVLTGHGFPAVPQNLKMAYGVAEATPFQGSGRVGRL